MTEGIPAPEERPSTDGGKSLAAAAASGDADRLLALLREAPAGGRELIAAQGREAMVLAAFYGNLAGVRVLLEHGCDPEARDSSGFTSLTLAAGRGHVAVVEALLDAGASPNSRHAREATPLMFVALRGRMDTARLLLDRGADPAAVDADGEAAWMYAAEKGHHELADLLGHPPDA